MIYTKSQNVYMCHLYLSFSVFSNFLFVHFPVLCLCLSQSLVLLEKCCYKSFCCQFADIQYFHILPHMCIQNVWRMLYKWTIYMVYSIKTQPLNYSLLTGTYRKSGVRLVCLPHTLHLTWDNNVIAQLENKLCKTNAKWNLEKKPQFHIWYTIRLVWNLMAFVPDLFHGLTTI